MRAMRPIRILAWFNWSRPRRDGYRGLSAGRNPEQHAGLAVGRDVVGLIVLRLDMSARNAPLIQSRQLVARCAHRHTEYETEVSLSD